MCEGAEIVVMGEEAFSAIWKVVALSLLLYGSELRLPFVLQDVSLHCDCAFGTVLLGG